jgi:hypothetical protein
MKHLGQDQPGKQLSLFPNEAPFGTFIGTDNPRHIRALNAMLMGPIMREELDQIAGCSNGPDLIDDLRERGLEVRCKRLNKSDRDGRYCRPGQYQLTTNDYQLVANWFNRSDKAQRVLRPH